MKLTMLSILQRLNITNLEEEKEKEVQRGECGCCQQYCSNSIDVDKHHQLGKQHIDISFNKIRFL